MKYSPKRIAGALSLSVICSLVLCSAAAAQTDRVYTDAERPVSGKLISITRDGIVMEVSGAEQKIPVGKISHMMFQGDLSGLTKGRDFAVDGQYKQALEELATVVPAKLAREPMKVDLAYYKMFCQGQLALSGNGDVKVAASSALAFVNANKSSFHFYGTAKLLGDLAMTLGAYDQALRYYQSMQNAPSTEMKIESVYLVAKAKLASGDLDAALAGFDKVAKVPTQSVAVAKLVAKATAGKAVAMARSGQGPAALDTVKKLIAELSSTDTDLAAEIYNAQGAAYEAAGDSEGAIFAYLHTHLMFSGNAASHAVALKRLVVLWRKVGKPGRANESREELNQRYPGLAS